MKISRLLFFPVILGVYALTFIATKKIEPCDDDCARVRETGSAIFFNRESYVLSVNRCSFNRVSDTLCIYVRDTIGINWNLFADTACIIATQKGLPHQKLIVMRPGGAPTDTLVKRQCP